MWRRNLSVWLLSASTAALFYLIMPQVMMPRGSGLLLYGAALFLFFVSFAFAFYTNRLFTRMATGGVAISLLSLLLAMVFFPSPVLLLLVSILYGLIWSSLFRGLLLSRGHITKATSHIYTGIAAAVGLGFVPLKWDDNWLAFSPAILTSAVYFLLAGGQQEEAHTEDRKSHINKNRLGIFMLVLAVAIEFYFVIWSLVLTPQGQDADACLTLLFVFLALFFLRRFTGKPILIKGSYGAAFLLAMLITIALGYLYTIHITWLFAACFVTGLAWFPSLLVKTSSAEVSVYLLRTAGMALAVAGLLSGVLLSFFYSVLEGLAIPEKLYLLAMRQALVKELGFLSALLIIFLGFFYVRANWPVRVSKDRQI